MLKKTSGAAVGCNQGPNRPSSSPFLSPRSLPSFSSKNFSMIDHSKKSPCSSPRNGAPSSCSIGSPAAGLAGVLAGSAEDGCKNRVLFGMRLRVQLPAPKSGFGNQPPPASSPTPIEFGVKNRDAQLALLSPVQRSPLPSAARAAQSEVELAEDYTCVITRGPNPRTTHIFEDCVVESCDGGSAADACCFLSSCYGCKKRLGQFGKDSVMHRGEKTFCSGQCRYQQMLFDGRIGESPDSSVKP